MNIITTELKRLANAGRFSFQGFRHAWKGEASFRFEVLLAVIMLPTAMLLNVSGLEKIALVGSVLLVLIVELLNSAVEAAIDRFGGEIHPISGKAKDMGSSAVFVALVFVAFTWTTIVSTLLFS
ncbi:diacylglycerol kinase [Aurantivibrio infirmus]